MKHLSIMLLAWMISFQAGKDLYVCKNANVTLFSTAPIEDIKAETSSGASVFNAATGEFVNLVEAGIIDPSKVLRVALQNAVSAAAMFLTTDAVVVELPKEPTTHDHGADTG